MNFLNAGLSPWLQKKSSSWIGYILLISDQFNQYQLISHINTNQQAIRFKQIINGMHNLLPKIQKSRKRQIFINEYLKKQSRPIENHEEVTQLLCKYQDIDEQNEFLSIQSKAPTLFLFKQQVSKIANNEFSEDLIDKSQLTLANSFLCSQNKSKQEQLKPKNETYITSNVKISQNINFQNVIKSIQKQTGRKINEKETQKKTNKAKSQAKSVKLLTILKGTQLTQLSLKQGKQYIQIENFCIANKVPRKDKQNITRAFKQGKSKIRL